VNGGAARIVPNNPQRKKVSNLDLGISGKRALVLASSRGLGLGIAQALAAEGANVILCGRDRKRLEAGVDAINAGGKGKAQAIPTDLTKAEAVAALNAGVDQQFGGVDILVNNVGGPPPKPISAVGIEEWQSQFETMVLSLLRVTGHFLPGMRQRKWGRILTIASSGVVQPIPNLGISNALRSTLVGWSKTLAAEVAAEGVTVNMIAPGRIHTDRVDETDTAVAKRDNKSIEDVRRASYTQIPAGRYGTVQEFAAAAAFLVSAPASYITGSIIRVDGGYIRSI
jgi:3-oxoacyl-[acyl-carrier protein] reductase